MFNGNAMPIPILVFVCSQMARAFMLMIAFEGEEEETDRLELLRSGRRHRQLLRQQSHHSIATLTETEFKAHYRLSKSLFYQLCSELEPLLPPAKRKTKLSLECKMLTALSFYATGSYQKPVGVSYLHCLGQPSVSHVIEEITDALNTPGILLKYIHFPQTRSERLTVMQGFSEKFGFPGVVGCVDGTHVALIRPTEHEERFYNRKKIHSRNVQIICDSDLNILNVDASYGGASHDAFIWRNCAINSHIQELHRSGETIWLLADSGYPLRPWLLTPIVNAPPGSAEEHYTNVHCTTRNVVELCIGVLKARWRCLLSHRVLHYKHGKVAKIINACSVLHNIANAARLPLMELTEEELARETNLQQGSSAEDNGSELEEGRRVRADVVRRLWNARHPH